MWGKKLLNKLATQTPVESQFCDLIELDISLLQVSSQEKEHYRVGKNAENSRDFARALDCFKKSTKSTKKPHISLLFIGPCLYKQARYLDALKAFTGVVKLGIIGTLPHKNNDITCIPPNSTDLFMAHYNRYV